MVSVDYVRVDGTVANKDNQALVEALSFIVDTGATYCVVPKNIADKLHLQPVGTAKLDTASGRIELPLTEALFNVDGHSALAAAVIADETKPAIIGMTLLAQLGLVVDPKSRTLRHLDGSKLKKRLYGLYAGVIAIAVAIPVAIKFTMPYIQGVDQDYAITFLVLFAGNLYELFNPWITKLIAYKKAITAAMEAGTKPPSTEEFFKHGVAFNKWYGVVFGANFIIALSLSWYILSTGAVTYTNWVANVMVNFFYAVGQAKLIKERVF